MVSNFRIYTDREGKMPILSYDSEDCIPISHSGHFVEYINDKPVGFKPYRGQDKIWNYAENKYMPATEIPILK